MTRAVLLAALVVATALAGCTAEDSSPEPETTGQPPLAPDRGAIEGLLIDDVFRPVAGGLVFVQGLGLTATTDADGGFAFLDLRPGTYTILVAAERHEAAPVTVDVEAGVYSEVEIMAQRIFSEGGTTITTSYSIFTACAASGVAISLVAGCILDDDSYRPGLHIKPIEEANVTYVVAEVVMNQADDYMFVLRCSNSNSFGCGEYAYTNISLLDPAQKGVYGKLVLRLGDNHMKTWQSHPWNNTDPMDLLVFYKGQGGDQVQPILYPAGCTLPPVTNPLNGKPMFCRVYYGAGARLALQGRIVLTVFLGEPATPVDDYQALAPP